MDNNSGWIKVTSYKNQQFEAGDVDQVTDIVTFFECEVTIHVYMLLSIYLSEQKLTQETLF